MVEQGEWMDAEAAARYLDCKPKTIYQMVNNGQLFALRFPVRTRREYLDACVERCRIKPGELAHLTNQYTKRTPVAPEPPTTSQGTQTAATDRA